MFANRSEVSMQVKKVKLVCMYSNIMMCMQIMFQFYEALEGTTQSEAIDLVIQTCRRTLTYGGLFFPVQELEVSTFCNFSF